ncbi:uncharacterized protein ACRADG_003360 [Cochliomyia hominivorax]
MSGSDLERILKIINAVKKHECLWNVNCSDYAKRDKLEKAWKDVAREVGNTEIFCREKWRNVRTGFLRSIQHRTPDESKRKRFYLHHQMSFLLPAAEALEETRKKRKLSKECSIRKETDDDNNSNDMEGDTTNLTIYDKVEKIEINDDEVIEQESLMINESDEEEVEHHTLFINGDIYTENDNTNNDIQKILKEIELKRLKNNNIKRKKSLTEEQQQNLSLVHNQHIDEVIVDKSISDNSKKSLFINENLNDDSMTKSNKNFDAIAKNLDKTTRQDHNSDREEQQLLYFFRGCVDDILSLNKQKRRLFKKRLLELIEELHDP